eukprot:5513447-Amphidinium_carterae.1
MANPWRRGRGESKGPEGHGTSSGIEQAWQASGRLQNACYIAGLHIIAHFAHIVDGGKAWIGA